LQIVPMQPRASREGRPFGREPQQTRRAVRRRSLGDGGHERCTTIVDLRPDRAPCVSPWLQTGSGSFRRETTSLETNDIRIEPLGTKPFDVTFGFSGGEKP
jgi:hypothetical protein